MNSSGQKLSDLGETQEGNKRRTDLSVEKSEPAFDEIARLAALICEASCALITLTNGRQTWLKACHGLNPEDVFPAHEFDDQVRASGGQLLIVPDTRHDDRFGQSTAVRDGDIRFYAGAPLLTHDGRVLGTLCVFDRNPREMGPEKNAALWTLSRQIVTQLEYNRTIVLRQKETEQLTLLGQALNASSDGIVITDARLPDNPLILVNPAFERITGYSAAESIGRNCRFLQNEDHDQPALKILRNAIRKKQSCRVVLKNFRKDGRPFWNELHVAPVRDASGETTHYIGIQSDITARKEADDALRQRDVILEGVSFAAETLLNEPDLETSLPNVLEQIGTATNSDHACLWHLVTGSSQQSLLSQVELWSSPDLPLASQASLRAVAWNTAQGWPQPEQLRQGRVIQKNSADCTPNELLLLHSLNNHTLLLLPVFTDQNNCWGALTLGCSHETTSWGFAEIEALRSATRVLGAVIHDRETGNALRVSEERFRSVVTNLKEVVFQTDAAGLWTFLNPAWEEVTGFPVEKSIGTPFLDYVHPDDRERNRELFLPLIERKKKYCRHEIRYRSKYSGFRWVEVFARLVVDIKDRIIGTAGTLNDITERKLAEETLQKQRAAIEAAIDGVAIIDAQERFTYVNPTFVSIFGYSHINELLGQSWHILHQPQERVRIQAEADPTLRSKGKWRDSVNCLRADGSTFAGEISLNLMEGGGAVCVCRDITERIEAEQFVLNSLKEKEVLLKEIHHRVKNNMQIVSSLLNLQLDHLQDEKVRTLFMESQSRIASMALVHEKLYQSNDLAQIDFTDYLRDLTDNLASMLGANTRNINFQLNCSNVELGIDTAIPCGLIINELVSNAYKHGFPNGGKGQVTLSLERLADERLRLEVADTGCGMPVDFDLRKTKSLGMQLVHTLVQQLRGTLEIQRDRGTKFILHLQENIRKEHHRT